MPGKTKMAIGAALLFSASAIAQVNNPSIATVTVSPSGQACTANMPLKLLVPAGTLWSCQNGVYGQVGGGSGTINFMSTLVSGQIAFGTTVWAPPVGSLNIGTTESQRVIALPRSGTVSHFQACINTVGNATGSLVYTFRLGALVGTSMADTAIVLTIPANAAIGCYPETHSFTYTAGQGVDIQIHSNATTGNAAITTNISFQLD